MNHWGERIFILVLFLFAGMHTGQAQTGGYVEWDSAYLEGQVLFDEIKPDQVIFSKEKGGERILYKAGELRGFGMKSAVYRSMEIDYNGALRPVFLRFETDGAVDVYTLREQDRIFIRSDRLTELDESTYKSVLTEILPACSENALRFLPYNRSAILALVRRYNKKGDCAVEDKFRFGIFGGYGESKWNVSGNSEFSFGAGEYESVSNYLSGGIYAKIPIWSSRGLYWMLQSRYTQHVFQTQVTRPSRDLDVSLTMSSVSFSPSLLYEFRSSALAPYLFAGPSVQHYFDAESKMFVVRYAGESATYASQENWLATSDIGYGANWGAGVRLTSGSSVGLSLEYQGTLHLYTGDYSFLVHSIQLKFGL